MPDLIDEVKHAFDKTREEQERVPGPIQVLQRDDEELALGFNAMRQYYEDKLHVLLRRGYRHFAGSSLPSRSDDLITHTAEFMQTKMIATTVSAFCDGVMINHQDDHKVKMCTHFNNVPHLFHDEGFRDKSRQMGLGFCEDPEVLEFFSTYVAGGVGHIAHITGFAHQEEMDHNKVWDIWLLVGTAATSAAYLAGAVLGSAWRERDVLDGIEIASEGDPRGSEGEVEPRS